MALTAAHSPSTGSFLDRILGDMYARAYEYFPGSGNPNQNKERK